MKRSRFSNEQIIGVLKELSSNGRSFESISYGIEVVGAFLDRTVTKTDTISVDHR